MGLSTLTNQHIQTICLNNYNDKGHIYVYVTYMVVLMLISINIRVSGYHLYDFYNTLYSQDTHWWSNTTQCVYPLSYDLYLYIIQYELLYSHILGEWSWNRQDGRHSCVVRLVYPIATPQWFLVLRDKLYSCVILPTHYIAHFTVQLLYIVCLKNFYKFGYIQHFVNMLCRYS